MKILTFLKSIKFKWLDLALLVLLIAGSFSPLVILTPTNTLPKSVQVKVEGKLVKTLNLTKNTSWTYTSSSGEYNTIQVKDHRVRVEKANCRDQIDVDAGWIDRSGQSLVCLPHSLVVTLVGQGPVKQDGKVVDYQ